MVAIGPTTATLALAPARKAAIAGSLASVAATAMLAGAVTVGLALTVVYFSVVDSGVLSVKLLKFLRKTI